MCGGDGEGQPKQLARAEAKGRRGRDCRMKKEEVEKIGWDTDKKALKIHLNTLEDFCWCLFVCLLG